jgi:hypothetical protein
MKYRRKQNRKFVLKSKKRFIIVLVSTFAFFWYMNSFFNTPVTPNTTTTVKNTDNQVVQVASVTETNTTENVQQSVETIEVPANFPFATNSLKVSDVSVHENALPNKFDFSYDLLDPSNNILEDFSRKTSIIFSSSDNYTKSNGITTFKGNNYRDSSSFGNIPTAPKTLEVIWEYKIGKLDVWDGVGWNGQPAIINWNKDLQSKMNLKADKKDLPSLKEVIYGTLDGNIYFLDLEKGDPTRSSINIGHPIKGSVTVDPRGYPLLYVGQGLFNAQSADRRTGFRIFNLYDQKELFFLDGMDPNAHRSWGAFDSNPLINSASDSLLIVGENGLFYSGKLNTEYAPEKSSIKISPKLTTYRYIKP